MDKKTLRKQILTIRNNIDKKDIQKKSEIIIKKLEATEIFKNSKNIMLFVSFGTEVMTHEFIKKCIDKGLSICIPYVEDEDKSIMKATIIKSLDDLQEGYKGILEVKEHLIQEVNPQDIELIVTPCVCYDYNRYRVGYGKGYYDRFFQKTKSKKIGVCFDECIVESIDTDMYDVSVDMVITDKRVFV